MCTVDRNTVVSPEVLKNLQRKYSLSIELIYPYHTNHAAIQLAWNSIASRIHVL